MTNRQYIDVVRNHLASLETVKNKFNLSKADIDLLVAEQNESRNFLKALEVGSILELCLTSHVETLRGL